MTSKYIFQNKNGEEKIIEVPSFGGQILSGAIMVKVVIIKCPSKNGVW